MKGSNAKVCKVTLPCQPTESDSVTFYAFDYVRIHGGAKKNAASGPSYLIANILKTPRPNCVEIGELLQNYMLNTVINFLFKNFIALRRHLAKTQLLS